MAWLDGNRRPGVANTTMQRRLHWLAPLLCVFALIVVGCGDDDSYLGVPDLPTETATASPTPTPTPTATPVESWAPGTTLASLPQPVRGGFLDLRGNIHTHSYFSHDACDNEPVKNGVRDETCFDDLRRGLCQIRHDFVMFTDHPSDFRDNEFPDTLLYRPARGDVLVERNGPVASWAGCPDGSRTLLLAGAESSEVMPVGLEGHVSDALGERGAVYGSGTPEAAARMRQQGAVILVAHPEGYTIDALLARDIDGFEMYNLHANLLTRTGLAAAARLLQRLGANDPNLLHPDLALLPIVEEDPRYLERWGSVLAAGLRRVTTMGSDAHRNTLPMLMRDGERIDSFRRMMHWFSNHLLVEPESDGTWDDRHLKDALRQRRLYGAFEVLGYPQGFEFYAASNSGETPIGGEVALAAAPELRVTAPHVRGLDPSREAPQLTTRILRAIPGGFEEVARGTDSATFRPNQPGAYRAEVRMVPFHLRAELAADATRMLEKDFVWIYANAIWVVAGT